MIDLQRNNTIIDEYCCACFNILWQSVVVYIRMSLITLTFLCSESKSIAGFDNNSGRIFKIAQSDFRSLCIQKSSYRQFQLITNLFYFLKPFCVFAVLTVAEIKTSHIHTRNHHISQYIFVIGCGTDCTNNFCLPHTITFTI